MAKKLARLLRYDWPLHFVMVITAWLPDNVIFIRLRGYLARPFFKSCGRSLGIGRNVTFYNPSKLSIGDNVYIAYGCWFSCAMGVRIDDEVLFGPYVVIASSNHTRSGESFRYGSPLGDMIAIEKGAWVGAHCTVTAGSTLGTGSVLAANSALAHKSKPNHLVAGTPAKDIKAL